MLNTPESTRLPKDIEKDIEQARFNLETLNLEKERVTKAYNQIAKDIVDSSKRFQWLQDQIKEEEKILNKIKTEIASETVIHSNLVDKNSVLQEELLSKENYISSHLEMINKRENDLTSKENDISNRISVHATNVSSFEEDRKRHQLKIDILNEALEKI